MINALLIYVLGLIIYIPIMVIYLRKKYSVTKNLLIFIFVVYLLLVIGVTIFPLPWQTNLLNHLRQRSPGLRTNIIPLKSIISMLQNNTVHDMVKQLVGNIILTIPFGFIYTLTFNKRKTLVNTIIPGIIFSILIELLQLLIGQVIGYSYRVVDIDDVLLNTIGITMGYYLFIIIKPTLQKHLDLNT